MKDRGRTAAQWFLSLGVLTLLAAGFAFKDAAVEQWFIFLLRSKDESVRYEAVQFLVTKRTVRAVPRLLARAFEVHEEIESMGLEHDDVVIPYYVGAVREFGADAVPYLVARLEDSPCRSAMSARILGDIGPEAAGAVPALIEALDRGRPLLCVAAIDALGKIGPRAGAALPVLRSLREKPPPLPRARREGSRPLESLIDETIARVEGDRS